MATIEQLIDSLKQRQELSDEATTGAVAALVDPDISAETKAAFLTALAEKGESPQEISTFARLLRDKAVPVPVPDDIRHEPILDVCGTGGDRLGTINVSTAVALLVASAGVRVAKHGNRAITSKSGSADVLSALGIPIDLSPDAAAQSLAEHHFAFFFAPNYHPAFKHIGPARKLCAEKKQRTIFNFLGPLLNPARPSVQLLGVASPALCEPMCQTLKLLGIARAMVVCGTLRDRSECMDEISIHGPTRVAEHYQERGFSTSDLDPPSMELPLPESPGGVEDLAGGDAEHNASVLKAILNGDETGPKAAIVKLNAAAALFVAGHSKSITEGWDTSESLIQSGKASEKLHVLTTT